MVRVWSTRGGGKQLPHRVDTARRCADFLAALARTANVRLALKEAGVSAYWAYRRRKADPDFDARWRTAVRTGRRDLAHAKAACARDPAANRPGAADGLVMVGSSGKGTLRLERVKACSFTEAKRVVFLAALRATCNVKAAARAAGVSAHGVYLRYHADAALRAEWEAALIEGRVHLEMALLAAGRALFDVPGVDRDGRAQAEPAPVAVTGMDAKVALQLLRLHAPRDAAGQMRGRWVKPTDAEATRREIMAKVAAVRAAREASAGADRGDTSVGRPGALPPAPSRKREGEKDAG